MTCADAPTTAGQEWYTLPTDILKIHSIFYEPASGGGWRLRHKDAAKRDPAATSSTSVAEWYPWGGPSSGVNVKRIGLNAVPSVTGDNIHILYRKLPLTMVSGGQAPEVPTEWQDALVSYAVWKVYRRWGREWVQMAEEAHAEWEEWLKRARRYMNPLTTDIPNTVTDTAGYLGWGD